MYKAHINKDKRLYLYNTNQYKLGAQYDLKNSQNILPGAHIIVFKIRFNIVLTLFNYLIWQKPYLLYIILFY